MIAQRSTSKDPSPEPSTITVSGLVLPGLMSLIILTAAMVLVPAFTAATFSLDRWLLQALAIDPEHNWFLHSIAVPLDNHMFKGAFVMMLFWGAWFSIGTSPLHRSRLIAVALLAFVALVVGRLLAELLPFRSRPRYNTDLAGPLSGASGPLEQWSSMPSDHAIMFFALAVGLCLISRPLGLVALVHAVVIVCLPRVGLWLHYPSDILVGALVGTTNALLLFEPCTKIVANSRFEQSLQKHPGVVYTVMFFVSFQIGSMFEGARSALKGLWSIFKTVAGLAALPI